MYALNLFYAGQVCVENTYFFVPVLLTIIKNYYIIVKKKVARRVAVFGRLNIRLQSKLK